MWGYLIIIEVMLLCDGSGGRLLGNETTWFDPPLTVSSSKRRLGTLQRWTEPAPVHHAINPAWIYCIFCVGTPFFPLLFWNCGVWLALIFGVLLSVFVEFQLVWEPKSTHTAQLWIEAVWSLSAAGGLKVLTQQEMKSAVSLLFQARWAAADSSLADSRCSKGLYSEPALLRRS